MSEDKALAKLASEIQVPQEILASNRPGAVYTALQLARSVKASEGVLRSRYIELCKHIHAEQMTPEGVTWVLSSEGFPKERISEIKRVCFDTDENFQAFVKGLIGFRAAVEAARSAPDSDPEVIRRLRWNKLFSAFDRLISKFRPVQRFHVANGQVLLTWKASDVEPGKKHSISFRDYRVVVERINKPDAKKDNSHDKENSGGTVPTGARSAGRRVSKHKRRGGKLPG